MKKSNKGRNREMITFFKKTIFTLITEKIVETVSDTSSLWNPESKKSEIYLISLMQFTDNIPII
jgi:hypothetical protein